jgi:hypothetical protein
MQYYFAIEYVISFFKSSYNLLLRVVKPIKPLQIIICVLALISGVMAGINSWNNAVRASHGCGEYSPSFGSLSPRSNAIEMFYPSVIIVFLTLISWKRASFKISTIIIAILYLVLVFYTYQTDKISHYSPCDRKGDESSFFLLLTGLIFLPMLWLIISAFVEFARFVYSGRR